MSDDGRTDDGFAITEGHEEPTNWDREETTVIIDKDGIKAVLLANF